MSEERLDRVNSRCLICQGEDGELRCIESLSKEDWHSIYDVLVELKKGLKNSRVDVPVALSKDQLKTMSMIGKVSEERVLYLAPYIPIKKRQTCDIGEISEELEELLGNVRILLSRHPEIYSVYLMAWPLRRERRLELDPISRLAYLMEFLWEIRQIIATGIPPALEDITFIMPKEVRAGVETWPSRLFYGIMGLQVGKFSRKKLTPENPPMRALAQFFRRLHEDFGSVKGLGSLKELEYTFMGHPALRFLIERRRWDVEAELESYVISAMRKTHRMDILQALQTFLDYLQKKPRFPEIDKRILMEMAEFGPFSLNLLYELAVLEKLYETFKEENSELEIYLFDECPEELKENALCYQKYFAFQLKGEEEFGSKIRFRPDFVLRKGNTLFVFDAKYKYEVEGDDVKQMYCYLNFLHKISELKGLKIGKFVGVLIPRASDRIVKFDHVSAMEKIYVIPYDQVEELKTCCI